MQTVVDPARGKVNYQDPFMDLTMIAEIDSYDPNKVIGWILEVKGDTKGALATKIMEGVDVYSINIFIRAE